jgi:hypothetical protein
MEKKAHGTRHMAHGKADGFRSSVLNRAPCDLCRHSFAPLFELPKPLVETRMNKPFGF